MKKMSLYDLLFICAIILAVGMTFINIVAYPKLVEEARKSTELAERAIELAEECECKLNNQ